jgi:outer membrane protein OmpA-like peptidoglycan-associated protein
MSDASESNKAAVQDEQMQQLRALLLGKDNAEVLQVLRENAREVVSEVFSEALRDRQQQDGSVNKVILPLVEKSVERSVADHSEQFVGYLYPLVGSLVRKSVTAFLTEFLEKTNELIENSLTIKGLKWRFRAWQAGVSFSQYVASQTFAFRVEQVLLIHRETGILIKSVAHGSAQRADADMVSGMLTAINDFVSDSFTANAAGDEQNLDVIKTGDFTLLLTRGPLLVLVAAISGNAPQKVADQLQVSVEYIHQVYNKELRAFKGNTLPFEPAEQQLRDCLLAELKPEVQANKKRPWLAWILLLLLLGGAAYYGFRWWQTEKLAQRLALVHEQPGIVLNDIDVLGIDLLKLSVLRDPDAGSIEDWLNQNGIPRESVVIAQKAYQSLDPQLLKQRLQAEIGAYPGLSLRWQEDQPILSGSLGYLDKQELQRKLNAMPGFTRHSTMLANVSLLPEQNNYQDNPAVRRAIFDQHVAKVDRQHVDFALGESSLSTQAVETLKLLAVDFKTVIDLARAQKLSVGLIIMGASDPIGTRSYNQQLSLRRAKATEQVLIDNGIDAGYLNAVGLGVVELSSQEAGARRVLFNVVFFGID